MSFVFGICGLGLVNGQPYKSTSLGLVCQSAKHCDGAGCRQGEVEKVITTKKTEKQAKYKTVSVRCPECIGVSKDALWNKPCPRCGKSQFISKYVLEGYVYVPVSNNSYFKENCQKCQGSGILSFGPHFQVADADFPEVVIDKDMYAFSSLGDGWRLPTKEELKGMYELLHRKGRGNFEKVWYWSSDNRNGFHFAKGLFHSDPDPDMDEYSAGLFDPGLLKARVRLVRALP